MDAFQIQYEKGTDAVATMIQKSTKFVDHFPLAAPGEFVPSQQQVHDLSNVQPIYEKFNIDKPLKLGHVATILGNSISAMGKLIEAKKREKAMEPASPVIDIKQEFVHFREYKIPNYRFQPDGTPKKTTPVLFQRVENPIMEFDEHFIQFIKSEKFPEKWRDGNCLDLACLRVWLGSTSITGNMDVMVHYLRGMISQSVPSPMFSNIWKASSEMTRKEIELVKRQLDPNAIFTGEIPTELSTLTLRLCSATDAFYSMNRKAQIAAFSSYQGHNVPFDDRNISVKVGINGEQVSSVSYTASEKVYTSFLSKSFFGLCHEGRSFVGPSALGHYGFTFVETMRNLSILMDISKGGSRALIRFILVKILQSPSKHRNRVEFFKGFDTLMLVLADMRSGCAMMPVVDAVLSMHSQNPAWTQELLSISLACTCEELVAMSSLAKTINYALVSASKGLEAYVQKTSRDIPIDTKKIESLRNRFRMHIVTSYIRKHRKVPDITGPDELMRALEQSAAGTKKYNAAINQASSYKDVKLGKIIDHSYDEKPESRIIDKSCTKDEYDEESNSVKELLIFLESETLDVDIDLLTFVKEQGQRFCGLLDRKAMSKIPNLNKYKKFLVRLVEKEKEMKEAARFYGIASMALKLYISAMMEKVKRVAKLLPGQMMTMDSSARMSIMHNMTKLLNSKHGISLMLDYSGHNTTQRPENTLFLLEEIADMYGMTGDERDSFLNLPWVFSNCPMFSESQYTDTVFLSHRQVGAIEGWFGILWGLQSQLMIEEMLNEQGFSTSIKTTYGDDVCAAIRITQNITQEVMESIVNYCQKYAASIGLILKMSQTQVTLNRLTMLKTHYIFGSPVDTSFKKFLVMSLATSNVFADRFNRVKSLDSSFASACENSHSSTYQLLLRNFLFLYECKDEMLEMHLKLKFPMDRRFIDVFSQYQRCKEVVYSFQQGRQLHTQADHDSIIAAYPDAEIMVQNYLHLNYTTDAFKDIFMMLAYSPTALFGYSLTTGLDAMISGYSLSNLKRLSFVDSVLSEKARPIFYGNVELSKEEDRYLSSPFPLSGGRIDTSLILKKALQSKMAEKISNTSLQAIIACIGTPNERAYRAYIINQFRHAFHHRITSAYIERSVYHYAKGWCDKVDNSTTLSFYIPRSEMFKIQGMMFRANFRIIEKKMKHAINFEMFSIDQLLSDRQRAVPNISFINLLEVPITGTIKARSNILYFNLTRSGLFTHEKGQVNTVSPAESAVTIPKYDRSTGVTSLFSHQLIHYAYDCVHTTKWLISEQMKFNGLSNFDMVCLRDACDITLSTFCQATYNQLEHAVTVPYGGRYFHRATFGSFNPRAGDISNQFLTRQYTASNMTRALTMLGGEDSNLNIALMKTTIRAMAVFSGFNCKGNMIALEIKESIRQHYKDVTFSLAGLKRTLHPNLPYADMIDMSVIMNHASVYTDYSNFTSQGGVENDYVPVSSIRTREEVRTDSAFIHLMSYMTDQCILIPQMVKPDMLLTLTRLYDLKFPDRASFFEAFYSFYQSHDLIGKESESDAALRVMLFYELFPKQNNDWMSEILTEGFSVQYRDLTMKCFCLMAGLVFRLKKDQNGVTRLAISKTSSIERVKVAYHSLKKGSVHLYIRKNFISDAIVKGLPFLSVNSFELEIAMMDLVEKYHGRIISQKKLSTYLSKTVVEVVPIVGWDAKEVQYDTISVDASELFHDINTRSLIKVLETSCRFTAPLSVFDSPTNSSAYGSAMGIVSYLLLTSPLCSVADLCGGRGDFHTAMTRYGVMHESISRGDGYNLFSRVEGMVDAKVTFDAFSKPDYTNYLAFDVFLFDVSHKTGCDAWDAIYDLVKSHKKRVIIRANSLNFDVPETVVKDFQKNISITALVPSTESIGLIYLEFTEKLIVDDMFNDQEFVGYQTGPLGNKIIMTASDALSNSINLYETYQIQDYTCEFISDELIYDTLLNPKPVILTTDQLPFMAKLSNFLMIDCLVEKPDYLSGGHWETSRLRMMTSSDALYSYSKYDLKLIHFLSSIREDELPYYEALLEKKIGMECRCPCCKRDKLKATLSAEKEAIRTLMEQEDQYAGDELEFQLSRDPRYLNQEKETETEIDALELPPGPSVDLKRLYREEQERQEKEMLLAIPEDFVHEDHFFLPKARDIVAVARASGFIDMKNAYTNPPIYLVNFIGTLGNLRSDLTKMMAYVSEDKKAQLLMYAIAWVGANGEDDKEINLREVTKTVNRMTLSRCLEGNGLSMQSLYTTLNRVCYFIRTDQLHRAFHHIIGKPEISLDVVKRLKSRQFRDYITDFRLLTNRAVQIRDTYYENLIGEEEPIQRSYQLETAWGDREWEADTFESESPNDLMKQLDPTTGLLGALCMISRQENMLSEPIESSVESNQVRPLDGNVDSATLSSLLTTIVRTEEEVDTARKMAAIATLQTESLDAYAAAMAEMYEEIDEYDDEYYSDGE